MAENVIFFKIKNAVKKRVETITHSINILIKYNVIIGITEEIKICFLFGFLTYFTIDKRLIHVSYLEIGRNEFSINLSSNNKIHDISHNQLKWNLNSLTTQVETK